MTADLPESCRQLIKLQRGVLARWQAPGVELKSTTINSLLRSDRWQPLQRGVYATFSGKPSRDAELWAAVLRVGPQAILSHQTAAELDGLTSTRKRGHPRDGSRRQAHRRGSRGYACTDRSGWQRRGIPLVRRRAPGSRRPFWT